MIDSNEDLLSVCTRARKSRAVALDTEFVWTSTYYPMLGVIQLGMSREDCHLIDAPEIDHPGPLGELLGDPDTVKILHDAAGDLAILHRLTGVLPAGIFDTRLAAGFVGLPATLSLVALVKELLDIELPKTESRSDWLQRPLTPKQLEYAIDDIMYMPEVRNALNEKLEANGNRDWFREESHIFENPEAYLEDEPEDCYRKVSGMGRLPPEQLSVLREITAWRERTARSQDRSRSRIIRDDQMMALASACPQTVEQMLRVRGVWRSVTKKYGEEIVEAIRTGLSTPPEDRPSIPSCPLDPRSLKGLADRVLKLVRSRARERQIDPVIVSARRDATSFVLDIARGKARQHPLSTTWRSELLGDELPELVEQIQADIR